MKHSGHKTSKLLPIRLILLMSFVLFSMTYSSVNSQTLLPLLHENDDLDQALMGNEISNGFQSIDSSRIETFTMNMPQLNGREKDIIIYLPADYFSGDRSYPVLYLQNAEEVFIFGRNEDGDGSWILNESIYTFFTENFEGDVIIVGSVSNPIFIWDEYGPWVNENMYHWMSPDDANRVEGGQGDAYLDFLIQTLKPEIDNRYRTLPDRDTTAIGGYDMGGLLSLYAGLTRSEVYSRVMALSPAIWFGEEGGKWLSNNQFLNLIDGIKIPENLSIYIDVADSEKSTEIEIRPAVNDSQGKKISFPRAYLEGAMVLMETLLTNGFPEGSLKTGLNEREITSFEITEEEPILDKSYYFPIFFSPPTPSRIEQIPFTDIGEYDPNPDRYVWVYLPPNYRDKSQGEGYNVIYLAGVQRIFGTEIGVYDDRDWKFDETLDRLYSETGIGIIAVGIESDRDHPWDEYTPFTNNNMDNFVSYPEKVFGKGESFLNMIVTELKPKIDIKYNTNAERENTAIGGGSRYAFFALYAGLTKFDIFSGVMAMSPAIWMAEGGDPLPLYSPYWFKYNNLWELIRVNGAPTNVQYFLHIGTDESANMPGGDYPYVKTEDGINRSWEYVYLNGADRIFEIMLEDDLIYGTTINYHRITGDDHDPTTWGTYVNYALHWLGFYD